MVKHVYIHIPFCLRKCHYCSFVSGFNIEHKDKYLNALFEQIKTTYKNEKISTLYIGGGTPSLLEYNDIKNIVDCFDFESDAEITLEVNPETVSKDKFIEIKKSGINRISLGVQSFNDDILKCIGRNHTKKDILNSIKIIKEIGFENISIDLIYGLPNQTIDIFKEDVSQALNLNVQHISTYGLKIENDSYFAKFLPKNLPTEDEQAEMFMYLCTELKNKKFNHYEISNFAQNGYESKHNCSYWQNKNYYGFGLNASGYENNIRYRNTSDFDKYLQNPNKKDEEITLTSQEILEEEIFLALRLKQGIDIQKINEKFNIDFLKKYENIIKKYTELKLLVNENKHIKLTEQGFLLSNEIMSEFIE